MAIVFETREQEEARLKARARQDAKRTETAKKPRAARIRAAQERASKPKPASKVAISLRLDADVVKALRAQGDGWQTRINGTLRKILKLPD